MRTILTIAFLAIGVALIWWEIHRHRYAIVRALTARIERPKAELRAELIEGGVAGLMFAGLIIFALTR